VEKDPSLPASSRQVVFLPIVKNWEGSPKSKLFYASSNHATNNRSNFADDRLHVSRSRVLGMKQIRTDRARVRTGDQKNVHTTSISYKWTLFQTGSARMTVYTQSNCPIDHRRRSACRTTDQRPGPRRADVGTDIR